MKLRRSHHGAHYVYTTMCLIGRHAIYRHVMMDPTLHTPMCVVRPQTIYPHVMIGPRTLYPHVCKWGPRCIQSCA